MNEFNFFSRPTVSGGVKLPVCLILDTSGSMSQTMHSSRGMLVKIDELNRNIDTLLYTIQNEYPLYICKYTSSCFILLSFCIAVFISCIFSMLVIDS